MNLVTIGRYQPSQWYSYELITNHYGIRTAKRSGVPLINHIHEGLVILSAEGADEATAEAYCLHPLVQSDDTLVETANLFLSPSRGSRQSEAFVLALEYRGIANGYLSDACQDVELLPVEAACKALRIKLGPMPQIREMLRADKIQNYKDFEQYHGDTHKDAKRLRCYFKAWFTALGITEGEYHKACELIERWREATINEITTHDL